MHHVEVKEAVAACSKMQKKDPNSESATVRRFGLCSREPIQFWLKKEESIRDAKENSVLAVKSGRKPTYPEMEEELSQCYVQARDECTEIHGSFFRDKGIELLRRTYPEVFANYGNNSDSSSNDMYALRTGRLKCFLNAHC